MTPELPVAATTEFLPGGWTLVGKIADGAGGAVLRVRRTVNGVEQMARARILAASRLSPEDFARRLAQAEASFQGITNPVIVPLTGGGTAHGAPFLTYELAEGATLSEYAAAHPRLSEPERLALFFTICRAVRQAHANLLPHGELGDAFIAVDEHGEIRVLDFGAVFLSGAGVATVRGDIEALGRTILPEVFAGRKFPAELQEIANKAAAGGYESVEQLALDVERYGKGFPVSARATTPGYRFWKFLSRHKALVPMMLGAVAVFAIAAWYSAVSIRERFRLEARLNETRGAAGLMAVQMPQHIASLPQSLELRRKMIGYGMGYLDEHIGELDPADRKERRIFALGYYEVATALGGSGVSMLGDYEEALKRYQSALDLFWQDDASLLPDAQIADAMGASLIRRVQILTILRRPAEARQAAEQCLTLAPRIRNASVDRVEVACKTLRLQAKLDEGHGVSNGEMAALERDEAELGSDKNALNIRMDARSALAMLYLRQGNATAALDQARAGLDLVAGINKGIGASVQKARLMLMAGRAETAPGGDREHAANRYEEAIDILRELMRREYHDLEARELLATALIESSEFANPEEPLAMRGRLLEADSLAKGLLIDAAYPAASLLRLRALGKLAELTGDCALRKEALAEYAKIQPLPGDAALVNAVKTKVCQ